MTLKVTDDILVDKIKNGDVNAISIGGYGKATKRLNFIERIFLFFDPKERKIRKMFKRKLKELNINSVALIEKQKESKNEN